MKTTIELFDSYVKRAQAIAEEALGKWSDLVKSYAAFIDEVRGRIDSGELTGDQVDVIVERLWTAACYTVPLKAAMLHVCHGYKLGELLRTSDWAVDAVWGTVGVAINYTENWYGDIEDYLNSLDQTPTNAAWLAMFRQARFVHEVVRDVPLLLYDRKVGNLLKACRFLEFTSDEQARLLVKRSDGTKTIRSKASQVKSKDKKPEYEASDVWVEQGFIHFRAPNGTVIRASLEYVSSFLVQSV